MEHNIKNIIRFNMKNLEKRKPRVRICLEESINPMIERKQLNMGNS